MRFDLTLLPTRAIGALAIASALNTPACNESVTFPLRAQTSSNEQLAPSQNADDDLQSAWQPSAVARHQDKIFFLDRGTRKLKSLDPVSGITQTHADLSPYEARISHNNAWDHHWGYSLEMLSNDVAVIAGLGRKLLFVDITSGDVYVFPQSEGTRIADDNIPVNDIDFSTLAGFGTSSDQLYLAFDNRIFSLNWIPSTDLVQSLDALSLQTLKHVAGSPTSGFVHKLGPAKNEPLSLSEWTHFAYRDQILYFWDPPRLRAVKNDRILNLGGDASALHSTDLADTRLHALPIVPQLRFCGSALCSANYLKTYFMTIHIQEASFETGDVAGEINYTNIGDPILSDFVPENDHLIYTASLDGGGLRKTNFATQTTTLLFGFENEKERFSAVQNKDPRLESNTLITPQSVALLDRFIITNAPSLGRMTISSLTTPYEASTFWLDLASVNPALHTAARNNHLWLSQGYALTHMALQSDQTLTVETYNSFFQPPSFGGIPAQSADVHLTSAPSLYPASNSLVAYDQDAGFLIQDIDGYTKFLIHPAMAFKLPSQDAPIDLRKLALYDFDQFKNSGDLFLFSFTQNDVTTLYAANAGTTAFSYLGSSIEPETAIQLSGNSAQNTDFVGLDITQTALPPLDAFALSQDGVLWFYTQNALYTVGDDKRIQRASLCQDLPDAPDDLTVSSINGHTTLFAHVQNTIYKCSDDAPTPTPLDAQRVHLCAQDAILTLRDNTFCIDDDCHTTTTPLFDAACLNDAIYLSMQDNNGQFVVYRAPRNAPDNYAPSLWNGFGVPSSVTLKKARLGSDLVALAIDQYHNLCAAFKDTCSLWRIPAADGSLQQNTVATRLAAFPELCQISTFAVSSYGDVAFATQNDLYTITDGSPSPIASLPAPILELGFIQHDPLVLTTQGLHDCADDACTLTHASPISLDGSLIDFAQPAQAHPRFIQYPGQDAVILPVMSGNQLLKLAF